MDRGIVEVSIESLNESMDKFIGSYSRSASSLIVNQNFNKGRNDTALKPKFLEQYPYAQLSAIRDTRTCNFCGLLDGHIISTAREDFRDGTWNPTYHKFCRCIWIFIHRNEIQYKKIKDNWKFNQKFIDAHLDEMHLKKLRLRGI